MWARLLRCLIPPMPATRCTLQADRLRLWGMEQLKEVELQEAFLAHTAMLRRCEEKSESRLEQCMQQLELQNSVTLSKVYSYSMFSS